MTYAEISPILRAYLGTFATLRALGFESDDIYFEVARSARFEGVVSGFALVRQGSRKFRVELGALRQPESEVAGEYQRVCAQQETLSEADRTRMMNECEARYRVIDLIVALKQKGFVVGDWEEPWAAILQAARRIALQARIERGAYGLAIGPKRRWVLGGDCCCPLGAYLVAHDAVALHGERSALATLQRVLHGTGVDPESFTLGFDGRPGKSESWAWGAWVARELGVA